MKKKILIIVFTLFFLCVGAAIGTVVEKKMNLLSRLKAHVVTALPEVPWDSIKRQDWRDEFNLVSISSSKDLSLQKAYFISSPERNAPLIISLHTWSGTYEQNDPLAIKALESGWNYIHPDFRGANNTENACLSELAISDIDDAIAYAINNGNVDLDNIFVIGVSGGGYAVLGHYLKTSYDINTFFSWVPISDLEAWYGQSVSRMQKYSIDILNCTGSDESLNFDVALDRSPLYWDLPDKVQDIEIYAGIHDGYRGSVPVSHSIDFYNKVAKNDPDGNEVGTEDIKRILTRTIYSSDETIGGRKLLYKAESDNVSLSIFDGGHEMLTDFAFERMRDLSSD